MSPVRNRTPTSAILSITAVSSRIKPISNRGQIHLIRTEEGTAAIDEALSFLRRQRPLPPLRWAEGLARSGAELVRAQAKSKETGHGSGRMAMAQRIQRHGHWTIAIGEAISYGPVRC